MDMDDSHSIPFPLVITTLVGLVICWKRRNDKLKKKKEEDEVSLYSMFDCCDIYSLLLNRIVVLTNFVFVHPQQTERTRRCLSLIIDQIINEDQDVVEDAEQERTPKRRRFIKYDRDRANTCIHEDYLCEQPRFTSLQFQRMFRLSKEVYMEIRTHMMQHDFYNVAPQNCAGTTLISIDVKLLIALKHRGHGCSVNSWVDYFQMGESTVRSCVELLCHSIANNSDLRKRYLRTYSREDAQIVSQMHNEVDRVPGMLGSLNCMHVQWKNCPVALQGSFKGKEKFCSIVLEAVADHNLRFWHVAFGFPGSCNNINILDVSPLHSRFLDGSHSEIDFPYVINGTDDLKER